ncbi:hypothetical protein WICPIJ_000573 [Wickerhamomyces pijperi]|uniref:Uncharacterized protein n=1 Tax=Wickerhamomyces pijperi TaxID=599730 RepID=A0A9P8QGK8_WICPI|nr:hypothetical protein WICPIJ_000573 [Wickerhamomyces pijperi]
MTDSSFVINHWKNRFKRFIVELHYLKNRTTYRDHVIQGKDPKKPLITLRTVVRCLLDENEGEIDQNETGRFELSQEDIDPTSPVNFEEEEAFTTDVHYNQILDHLSASQSPSGRSKIGAGIKDLLHSIRSRNDSDEELERLRHECDCFCHNDNVSTIDETHNNHCVRFCVQINEEEDLATIERLMSNQVINYIEPEQQELQRRKYWFFGPKISVSTPQMRKPVVTKEVPRVYNNIEIIAQSLSPPPDAEELQKLSSSLLEPHVEPSSFSRKHLPKSSTPSEQKHRSANLKDCKCPICERHKKLNQGGVEPWKVVMNDISLYAALVSTGSKPNFHSKSSLNIAADFTSSKHNQPLSLQQKLFNDKRERESSALREEQLINLNDENEDVVTLGPKQGSQRSNRSLGNLSIKSLLDNTKRSLSGSYKQKSPAYAAVFQDYDYSDDEGDIATEEKKTKSTPPEKLDVKSDDLNKKEPVSSNSIKLKPEEDRPSGGKLSKIQMLQQSFMDNTTEISPLKLNNIKALQSKFS